MQILHVAVTWIRSNPLIAWPILTALVTVLFKPRTPADYEAMCARNPAWLWPRIATALQLFAALGLDPVKAMQVLRDHINRDGGGGPADPVVDVTSDAKSVAPGADTSDDSKPVSRWILVSLLLGAVGLGGCSLFTKSQAKSAIDAVALACILERSTLDDQSIADACNIADSLIPSLKDLLAVHRKAVAKATSQKALACGGLGDAGAPDGGDAGR